MRRAIVLVCALVLATAALSAVSPTSAVNPAASEAEARAGGSLIIKPGQIGKARIRMNKGRAMATGQFNQDVANPPCDPIDLQPKRPFRRHYSVFVGNNRIVEMNAFGRRLRTSTGVRVDSTYRRVKRAYGGNLSAPQEVGYGQWGAYVHVGRSGPQRKWIGFLFGKALVADGPLRGNDTVTLIGVTKGQRPPLMIDGC